MRKFILSFLLIVVFSLYIWYERGEISYTISNPLIITDDKEEVKHKRDESHENGLSPQSSSRNATAPKIDPRMTPNYKDGQYTGSVADAYYGNVQVQTIIQNGKITDVKFLEYPNDRRNSIAINTYAMPILKTETIQAQNADADDNDVDADDIDIVSGATFTSQAFIESLNSALSRAKVLT